MRLASEGLSGLKLRMSRWCTAELEAVQQFLGDGHTQCVRLRCANWNVQEITIRVSAIASETAGWTLSYLPLRSFRHFVWTVSSLQFARRLCTLHVAARRMILT